MAAVVEISWENWLFIGWHTGCKGRRHAALGHGVLEGNIMRFKSGMVGCILLGASLSACSGGVDVTESAESEESQAGFTLAALELSSTHRVEFRAYPEAGVVGLFETGNSDADKALPRGPEGESFEDAYVRLAGSEAKADVYELLAKVAADPAAAPRHDLVDSGLRSRANARAIEPNAERVGETSQALCAEPANHDWVADDQAFRRDLCPAGAQYCETLRKSHSDSRQTANSDTSFKNMSHCSNAFYTLHARYAVSCGLFSCTRADFQLEKATLAPRDFRRHAYWGRRDAAGQRPLFKAWISSEQGNWTALSHWAH